MQAYSSAKIGAALAVTGVGALSVGDVQFGCRARVVKSSSEAMMALNPKVVKKCSFSCVLLQYEGFLLPERGTFKSTPT